MDRDSCEGNKFLKICKVFSTCLGFGTVLPIHSLKMPLQNLTQPTYHQPPSNSQDNLQGLFSMVHGYLGIVQPNSFPKGKNCNDARITFHIINIITLVQNAIGFFIKLVQPLFFSLCGLLRLSVVKDTHLI